MHVYVGLSGGARIVSVGRAHISLGGARISMGGAHFISMDGDHISLGGACYVLCWYVVSLGNLLGFVLAVCSLCFRHFQFQGEELRLTASHTHHKHYVFHIYSDLDTLFLMTCMIDV